MNLRCQKFVAFAGLLAMLTLAACGTTSPVSPGPVVQPPPVSELKLPEIIQQGWDAAKGRLFEDGFTCVVGQETTAVKWEFSDGIFDCGGVLANGCFWKTGSGQPTIRLNQNALSVNLVAHEASHYLLWACKHPLWKCYLWEDDNFFHQGCS